MKIFTIGFTKKSAKEFFGLLNRPEILRVLDIRINNTSQLAGFAKKDDLQFFLNRICNLEYFSIPVLAPTKDLLDSYRKKRIDWTTYESKFLDLMIERRVQDTLEESFLSGACLLCSEESPQFCHRRLVAEYLTKNWSDVEIEHL